jgi:hypothetical protein
MPIRARPVPEHPFMAPNGQGSVHLDAYQSDTYAAAGPLEHSPEVTSTLLADERGTVTFNKQGRIIVVCAATNRIADYLLNPISLETLAKFDLPAQGSTGGFGAGGYFFLDNNDRAVSPTRGRDIWRIKEVDSSNGPAFAKDHTCANHLPAMIPSDPAVDSCFRTT